MELNVWWFIGCIINMATVIYLLSKITEQKIDFKNYKFYVFTVLLFILNALNIIYTSSFIKITISTFLSIVYCYLVFTKNTNKAIMSGVFEQFTLFIAESVVLIIITMLSYNNPNWQFSSIIGQLYVNVSVSLLAIIIIKIKKLLNFYKKIIVQFSNVDEQKKYLFMLLLIITLNIFLGLLYFGKNIVYTLIINLMFIVIYSLIMYFALRERHENIQFRIKNQTLMKNLNDYERMLDRQRVANHENKNQLLVVKNMIEKEEPCVIEYLNEIIKDKRKDNDLLYVKVQRIPTGGLQGIIYQKMLLMEELKINFDIEINNNIKIFDFSKLKSKDNYDICRLVGIFLDNAIEESERIDNKNIDLHIYTHKNNLVLEISNNFGKMIELDKIDSDGYTTKGNGHGYGLSLAKQIVENNSNIINERKIVKNIFVQIIKIKM